VGLYNRVVVLPFASLLLDHLVFVLSCGQGSFGAGVTRGGGVLSLRAAGAAGAAGVPAPQAACVVSSGGVAILGLGGQDALTAAASACPLSTFCGQVDDVDEPMVLRGRTVADEAHDYDACRQFP
jgi:hypothetical protein